VKTNSSNKDYFCSGPVKKALKAVFVMGIVGCTVVLIPAVRFAIITFGENLIHRQLNDIWNYQLLFMACAGLFVFITLGVILSKIFQEIRIPDNSEDAFYTITSVILIGIFSGMVMFLATSNQSMWLDEVYSLAPVKHTWKEILVHEQADVHPPLFFLLEKCWSLLLGDGILAMKYLAMLPVILTMVVTTWFLRKEFSNKAAVLFLLCFIASETIVHYSIEIRMYSWALLFIIMTALAAWFIINTGKTIWWAVFVLSAEAAAYTHYYAAALAVIGYLFLLAYILKFDRKKLLKALLSALAAILLYVPWLPSAINSFTRASNDFWISPVTIKDIIEYGYTVFLAGNRIVSLCFFGVFCVVFCKFLVRKNKTKEDGFAFGGLCCIIILAVTGILIAMLIRPLLQSRYFFPGYGLVWLFFAIEGASIKHKEVFVLVCGILLSFGIVTMSSSVYKERKEHRDFTQFYTYMLEEIGPDDLFIFPSQEGHTVGITAYLFPGHWYAYKSSGALIPSFGELTWTLLGSTRIDYDALSNTERFSGKAVWLIVSEQDSDGKPSTFVLPPDVQAQYCGFFGWSWYSFRVYRIGSPAALIPVL
jgi:hypothetical protein